MFVVIHDICNENTKTWHIIHVLKHGMYAKIWHVIRALRHDIQSVY